MNSNKSKLWKNFTAEGLPFGIFCGSAMLIVSLWFGWYSLIDSFENYKISKWQAVECDIISSEVQDNDDSVYKVVYRYKWQNDYFQSDRYQYEWDGESSLYRDEAVQLAEKYKPGDKSICYINPDKPKEAVLSMNEPYFLPYIAITAFLTILGARQICLGIKRFLRGELAEHKNGDLDDVHFEASKSKGIGTKIWAYLTGFGLFLTFLLNFPMAILITVFYYTIIANSGKYIEDIKYKLIKIELNAVGHVSKKSLTDKEVHLTIPEKFVIGVSLVIYFLILILIAKHTDSRDYFGPVGVVFCGLWLGLFMSAIVWMIISMMHGYHYIALREKKKEPGISRLDLPIWSLLVSNLIVIVWAVVERWSLRTILWVYWGQSLCIGFFLLIKALALKEVVSDFGASVKKRTKVLKVLGFLSIYTLFHGMYLVFLIVLFEDVQIESGMVWTIIFAIGIFFVQQIITFVYDFLRGNRRTNIDNLIETTGLRIIPMHLTIMGAGFLTSAAGLSMDSPFVLMLFLGLRAFGDIGMCLYTRKGFSKKMDAILENHTPDDFEATGHISTEQLETEGLAHCLCDKKSYFEGIKAHEYAKGHLKVKQLIDFGRQVEYTCPVTGQCWLLDFSHETEANQEYYSRLRKVK